MRIAKPGLEEIFNIACEKVAYLRAETDAKLADYRNALECEFEEKTKNLNDVILSVSDEVVYEAPTDEVVEPAPEVAEPVEEITETVAEPEAPAVSTIAEAVAEEIATFQA